MLFIDKSSLSPMNYIVRLSVIIIGITLPVILFVYILTSIVWASVQGWNPGRIIDDTIFTNNNAMSAVQVQGFINSKGASCVNGESPCLKNFNEGGRSAAQIIYDTSQEFRINPQVLLVVLQKETGLVTVSQPGSWRYRTAMGYGCPDSTPGVCDSSYYGFTNQVRWASRMYRAIMDASPTWYTPYVVGNNRIKYNPSNSCGDSIVNIENRATQALYNYTPYQPNQAALDAGWGEAPCGAYGNRNFFQYFKDWFGSTRVTTAVYIQQYTNIVDSLGSEAKIGFSLSQRPVGEVVLILSLSNQDLTTFTNNSDRLVISPENWNKPENNIVSISGKSGIETQSIDTTLKVIQIGSPDNNFSYIDPVSIGQPMIIWQPVDGQVYRLFSQSKNKHIFTPRKNEIAALTQQGYTNEGPVFQVCGGGDATILRYKRNQTTVNTPRGSAREASLIADGFTFDSAQFSYSTTAATVPVFELYNATSDNYIYTTDLSEANAIVQTYGYINNGPAFNTCSSGQRPVFRLYNSITRNHLLTRSVSERNNAVTSYGFSYEGAAFYVKDQSSQTDVAVYRLYSPSKQTHFYTSSLSEKNSAIQIGYLDEGIAFTARPSSQNSLVVYRLYNKSTGRHFFTSSILERDYAINFAGFTSEGIGFSIDK